MKCMPMPIVKFLKRRYPEIERIKKDVAGLGRRRMAQYCIAISDGRGNPHTKAYTIREAKKLFSSFSKVKFVLKSGTDMLESRFKFIERYFGWCLYAYLTK